MISLCCLRNRGVSEWFLQRGSALIMLLYLISVVCFWFEATNPALSDWAQFLFSPYMRFLGVWVVLSVVIHGWVGLSIVFTDYVKSKSVRRVLSALVMIWLLALGAAGMCLMVITA